MNIKPRQRSFIIVGSFTDFQHTSYEWPAAHFFSENKARHRADEMKTIAKRARDYVLTVRGTGKRPAYAILIDRQLMAEFETTILRIDPNFPISSLVEDPYSIPNITYRAVEVITSYAR